MEKEIVKHKGMRKVFRSKKNKFFIVNEPKPATTGKYLI